MDWIERLHRFAATLPRKDALQLGADLCDLQTDLEEIVETVSELAGALETWGDDEMDQVSRRDARDEADSLVNSLESTLMSLRKMLGEST
jgi:hypothetical protein